MLHDEVPRDATRGFFYGMGAPAGWRLMSTDVCWRDSRSEPPPGYQEFTRTLPDVNPHKLPQ